MVDRTLDLVPVTDLGDGLALGVWVLLGYGPSKREFFLHEAQTQEL